MQYKVWNKKEKINNVDAEYVINSLNIRETDGVFLVIDHLEEVQAIEIDRIIKGVYNLDKNLTVDEVAKEYIKIKEEEKQQAQKSRMVLEGQEERIIALEEENIKLKEVLELIKITVNEVLVMITNLKGE